MRNRRRILAGLLSAVMMVSMLPGNVFAVETGSTENEPAIVSSEEYSSEETAEEVQNVETEEEHKDQESSEEAADENTGSALQEEQAEEAQEVKEEPAAEPAAEKEEEPAEKKPAEEKPAEEKTAEEEPAEEEPSEEPAAEEKDTALYTLKAHGSDYTVTITYDAYAGIPDGARIKVEEVFENSKQYDYSGYVEQAAEAIEKDVSSVNYVRLFDISIIDADKEKVVLTGPVDVQIRLKDMEETRETTQVVHFAEKSAEVIEPEVIAPEVDGNQVAFTTEGFSVYAVIVPDDPTDENYEYMAVIFHGKDGTSTPIINTVYVRESDLTDDDELASIVYDPGAGTVPQGFNFYGWYTSADYPADSEEAKTIGEIRDYIATPGNFEAGTTLDIYGVYLAYYTVNYVDNNNEHNTNVSLGKDTIYVKELNTVVSYTLDMDYDYNPNYEFNGWLVTDGISNIVSPEGITASTLFAKGTQFQIKGDVQFSIKETKGNWLIFNENGQNASYNAPRFVPGGQNTSDEGLQTVRRGYTFDGWWTGAPAKEGGDPTGSRFTFGSPINETTNIYAKWTTVETAEYTVIIWLESLKDNYYDFEESITFTGTVGQAVSPASFQGSGVDHYAVITGEQDGVQKTYERKYKGFNCTLIDVDRVVEPDGSTVVNVRFKRNTYTLTFSGVAGVVINPITAKYGAFIGDYFPYGGPVSENYPWIPQNSQEFSGEVLYIATMRAENTSFKTGTNLLTNSRYVYYYVEMLPGETGTDIHELDGKSYRRFGYLIKRDRTVTNADIPDFPGFEPYKTDPEMDQYSDELGQYYYFPRYTATDPTTWGANRRIDIYLNRKNINIRFFDGVYLDGDGKEVKNNAFNQILFKEEQMKYGENMTSLNDPAYIPELTDPTDKDQYVFMGWYKDRYCQNPMDFSQTVPSKTVNLYALWRQKQFRVFLHPNAGTSSTNPTLDWGSEDQQMNFRISYDELLSLPTGSQVGYDFQGWFYDEKYTHPINAAYLGLSDSEYLKDYDTSDSANYTDNTMDKWGNGATTNADVSRSWVVKKFDAYAKWKRGIEGADGVAVSYDALEGGSNAPSDTALYDSETEVVAGKAPTPPQGSVFKCWAVQKWNGSEFVPSGVTVVPGQTFTLHVEDAKITRNSDNAVIPYAELVKDESYTYVMQLKAVYETKETETLKNINWYLNDGSGNTFGVSKNVKINVPVLIPGVTETPDNPDTEEDEADWVISSIPERTGYWFLGWATSASAQTEGECIIKYDIDPNSETEECVYDHYTVSVDAEKRSTTTEDEALYAVWEAKTAYTIVHSSDGTSETQYLKRGASTLDLTGVVKKDFLYGGYSTSDGGSLATASGMEVTPHGGETYYLREVSVNYLKPQVYITYYENYSPKKITGTYLLLNLDDPNVTKELYNFVELSVHHTKNNNNEGTVDKSKTYTITEFYDSIVQKKGEQETKDISYVDLFGTYFNDTSHKCYAGLIDLGMDYNYAGDVLEISTAYVTKDNIRVPGSKIRMVRFGNGSYSGSWAWSETNNKGIGSGLMKSPYSPALAEISGSGTENSSSTDPNFAAPKKAGTYAIQAPGEEKKKYTVTKISGSETTTQEVEEGNRTGQITYTDKDGYMFAGWYTDKAFKNPADFSNVTADMEVYARYISQDNITLTLGRSANLIGSVPFDAAVSVKSSALPDDIEVSCVKGAGTFKASLDTTKKVNVGTKKKPVYAYKHQGTVTIANVGLYETFTIQVIWTTPDGTRVEGKTYKVGYSLGKVTLE